MRTRAVYIGLDGILSSIASGQVDQVDPAAYDRILPTDHGPQAKTAATDIES